MNNNNELPFLRVTTLKKLGSKLAEKQAYFSKLASTNEFMKGNILKERNKYLFVVAEPLLVQTFAISGPDTVSNVSEEYLKEGNVIFWENGRYYSTCSVETTTKALALLMIWHNPAKQQFYYATYFLKIKPFAVTQEMLNQAALLLGYDDPNELAFVSLNTNQSDSNDTMDVEDSNTNVVPTVSDLSPYSVVPNNMNGVVGLPTAYFNPETQCFTTLVYITAVELRKWVWEAKVVGVPSISFMEQYMRGGQACNSVITRCKEIIYDHYSGPIEFIIDPQSRAKDSLKVMGQKFLTAVMDVIRGGSIKQEPNNVAYPDHVVVIKVFKLERPQPGRECWIAQVDDDKKQLAFEKRSKSLTDEAFYDVVGEIMQLVRGRLQTEVEFTVESQHVPHDPLRDEAGEILTSATTHAASFANWTNRVKDYFS